MLADDPPRRRPRRRRRQLRRAVLARRGAHVLDRARTPGRARRTAAACWWRALAQPHRRDGAARVSAWPPNQPHRAEVAKLLVHPDARRRGIARALMVALEATGAGRTTDAADARHVDRRPGRSAVSHRSAITWSASIPRFARGSIDAGARAHDDHVQGAERQLSISNSQLPRILLDSGQAPFWRSGIGSWGLEVWESTRSRERWGKRAATRSHRPGRPADRQVRHERRDRQQDATATPNTTGSTAVTPDSASPPTRAMTTASPRRPRRRSPRGSPSRRLRADGSSRAWRRPPCGWRSRDRGDDRRGEDGVEAHRREERGRHREGAGHGRVKPRPRERLRPDRVEVGTRSTWTAGSIAPPGRGSPVTTDAGAIEVRITSRSAVSTNCAAAT